MQNNNLYDPQFLAGIMMMQGRNAGDALSQAAITSHNMQQAQMQQQQYAQQQFLAQQLPQILSEVNTENPHEMFNALIKSGIAPNEAALIIDRLRPSAASTASNIVSGQGGVKYEKYNDPQTGALNLRKIPGQDAVVKNPLSVSELRVNATKIRDLDNEARGAERELRLLEDSEDAFKQFDAKTGKWTGAGTATSKIVSNYLPKGAENLAYNQEAQGARQRIDKLNSQLFQNRVQALGARATDAAKAEIVKGLPTVELTPDARHDLIATKKRENYEQILRSKFFNEWAKKNNRDLNGAEVAFGEFVTSGQLLDAKGNVNRELLKQIPAVVSQYLDEGSSQSATAQTMYGEEGLEDIYAQFEERSLEEALAEKARRGRR